MWQDDHVGLSDETIGNRHMLLTCPNCETVFRVDSASIGEDGRAVRCSVCSHVWQANPPMLIPESESGEVKAALGTVLTPFIALVLIVGLLAGGALYRSTITAYAPTLIGFFDGLGLTVSPEVNRLQIADLNADYAGDTLRLRGQLVNRSAFSAHAPSLEVTVISESGQSLANRIIRPDDDVIGADTATEFFTQLVIEISQEPTVTVVMLDEPVARRSLSTEVGN